MSIIAFTRIPYDIHHWLGDKGSNFRFYPNTIVMLGGSGMPSESNLIRLYYTVELCKYYKYSDIILAHPKDSGVAKNMRRYLINAGIDSGHIITAETVDIRLADSLYDAHKMVMEQAHELYLKAIRYLLQVQPPYIAVDQSEFPNGKIFYTKMWTAEKRAALLRNWRNRSKVSLQPPPRTISLPDLSPK